MDSELAALRREVAFLRSEVGELRAELTALRTQVAAGEPAESEGFSVIETGYPSAGASSNNTASGEQTWAERELICKDIGAFLRRCLAGIHRGGSGRDNIRAASRYWIVVRDFDGTTFSPVKVFSSFASAARLTKKGASLGKSVTVGVPSQREIQWVIDAGGFVWEGRIEQ